MLRKLKTNVTGNVTKDIKTIKKTRAGDLLLEMDNEDNLHVLKEELKKHVGEAEVKSLRGNSAAVHVYDVDAVTTAEELVAVVESVTGPGTIIVTSMRPMAGSRQAATLESSGENVEKLLRQQNIRIGWSSCRIQKKIPINRCFNCGSISHMAKGCKEKPMGDKCRRCGGGGHKGADYLGTNTDVQQIKEKNRQEQIQKAEEDRLTKEWNSKRRKPARTPPTTKLKINKDNTESDDGDRPDMTENFQSCSTTPNTLQTGTGSAGFFEDNVFESPFFQLTGGVQVQTEMTEEGTEIIDLDPIVDNIDRGDRGETEGEGPSKKRERTSDNPDFYEEDGEMMLLNVLNTGGNKRIKKIDSENYKDKEGENQEEEEEDETPLLTLTNLEAIEEIAKAMAILVQENSNTKREIKDKTKALVRAVKRLREEVDHFKFPNQRNKKDSTEGGPDEHEHDNNWYTDGNGRGKKDY
ncbi:unnamed protein product [Psylliodes chrysocephalus]|uniref:CCHC-type domain-containing protein n=1 Tax=Psylliodes chrysocephalus TaxID=3402493 RepID=A0A9P0GBF8_9CUCU|nr:unnamed protein product [Psylliodes chrysocephala]